jgi:hypothetical protein
MHDIYIYIYIYINMHICICMYDLKVCIHTCTKCIYRQKTIWKQKHWKRKTASAVHLELRHAVFTHMQSQSHTQHNTCSCSQDLLRPCISKRPPQPYILSCAPHAHSRSRSRYLYSTQSLHTRSLCTYAHNNHTHNTTQYLKIA